MYCTDPFYFADQSGFVQLLIIKTKFGDFYIYENTNAVKSSYIL